MLRKSAQAGKLVEDCNFLRNNSTPINVAASVKQRLLNRARANKEDVNLLPTKYGLERVLCHISNSLRRTDEYVFGVLAVESEPVDRRF